MRLFFLALILALCVPLLGTPAPAHANVACMQKCQSDWAACELAVIAPIDFGDPSIDNQRSACAQTRQTCEQACPQVTTTTTTTISAPTPVPTIRLNNPLGTNDPRVLISRLIGAIIGLSGAIALVMFVYAGLMFLTAGGNPTIVGKAKLLMLYVILGIIVIAGAFVITNTIMTSVLTGNPMVSADGTDPQ